MIVNFLPVSAKEIDEDFEFSQHGQVKELFINVHNVVPSKHAV